MLKLFRTSLEQTGVAMFINSEGKEKAVPLFSNEPCEEARKLRDIFIDYKLKDIYYSNNMIDYKIEDLIKNFKNEHGFLPEDYIEELVCGFPHIPSLKKNFCFCYE